MFHTLFIKHPTQTDLSICTFNRNKRSILFSHSLLYLNIHPQSPWIQLLWWIPPLSLTYTGVINSSLHRQTNRQSYNITSTNPWFYRNQKQTLSDQSFVDINFYSTQHQEPNCTSQPQPLPPHTQLYILLPPQISVCVCLFQQFTIILALWIA